VPAALGHTSITGVWTLRLASLLTFRCVIERLYVRPDEGVSLGASLLNSAVAEQAIESCSRGLRDAKFAQVRSAALGVVLALLQRTETEARIVAMPHTERMAALVREAQLDAASEVVLAAKQVQSRLESFV
jgi:hypothetical protein